MRRFRRPHPPLPEARRRRADRLQRRAEDRRALDVAALRGRRTRHRGHPRRRRRGRGRHRQYPHARGRAEEAEGPQRARDLRGARRGLHDQAGVSRAQRAAEGGRRHHLRQSAQFGGGLAAPEGSLHHRLASARLLRLCLGRDERDAGRDPVRHDLLVRALRLQDQSADQNLPLGRATDRVSSQDRGAARQARLRHRRRRLQGRPHRLAGAPRLRLAHAALGDRAQVPGRARHDRAAGISRSRSGAPARSRRSASWSRSASAASSCRTSRCTTRITSGASAATASNCARAATSGSATPSSSSAPATSFRRWSTSCIDKRPKDAKALSFSEEMPVSAAYRRGARGDRDRRGGLARPLHRRVRLSLPEDRAPETVRLAPRLRHRRPRREADRILLRAGLGEGAGRYLHA